MAKKFLGFTPTQQHTLLSRMGYSGPADRESMDKFVQSNPAAASKMGNLTQKALERLNPTPKMAEGGAVDPNRQRNAKAGVNMVWSHDRDNEEPSNPNQSNTSSTTPSPRPGDTPNGAEFVNPRPPSSGNNGSNGGGSGGGSGGGGGGGGGGASGGGSGVNTDENLTPEQIMQRDRQKRLSDAQQQNVLNSFTNPMALITQATAGQVDVNSNQFIDPLTGQVRDPRDIETSTVNNTTLAEAPDKINAATVTAETVSKDINKALSGVEAATAKPSAKATVQGQLADLMKDFEGGGTPPWASGAMRAAMATMQSRGLGASSMAGAAVVQAAMESAIGIASQDAATQAQFEMKNLDNQQQTLIFKTQARITGLLSDQAAENASKQFNASSKNQTNQFFAGLQESVSKFNADQINAIRQFNAGETNATNKFNSQMDAARDQFNAQNSLVIAQANAQWRQTIATTNTAAQHDANMQNAQLATGMTTQAMDALWQRERDLLSFAFQGSESALDRSLSLMLGEMDYALGKEQLDQEEKEGWGQLLGTITRGLFG